MQETRVQSLGREDHLEKEMVTHSSILAWRSLVGYNGVPKSWTQLSDFTHSLCAHNRLRSIIYREIGNKKVVAQRLKHLPDMQETQLQSLGQEDPLEKEMATHSSTLAWRISWREEPGRLQSMGSQRVGHD